MKAVKILINKKIPKEERYKQAIKIFTTIVATSIGVIISEVIMKQVLNILPELLKDAVKSVIEILITGVISIVLLYAVLNIGVIFKKILQSIKSVITYASVSLEALEENYNNAVDKIEQVYHEWLLQIKEKYKKEGEFQTLLSDMSLTAGETLNISINYARENDLKEEKILKNLDEIDNFFRN